MGLGDLHSTICYPKLPGNLTLRKPEGDEDFYDAESSKVKVLQDSECLRRDLASGSTGIELVKNETHSAFWAFLNRIAGLGILSQYCLF